jgi:hypothetical protein
MKKREPDPDDDPLDREIDLTKAKWRPNPFAAEFYKFRNVVMLAPDVLTHFPDSMAVNAALRELIAQRERKAKRSAKTASAPRAAKKK